MTAHGAAQALAILVAILDASEPQPRRHEDDNRYYCPACEGAAELYVDTDPRDPAAGHYVKCWTCGGKGVVTRADLDAIDEADADRCDDYTPPVRNLEPAPTEKDAS